MLLMHRYTATEIEEGLLERLDNDLLSIDKDRNSITLIDTKLASDRYR
jgi:hypothetical protein